MNLKNIVVPQNMTQSFKSTNLNLLKKMFSQINIFLGFERKMS